MTLFHGTNQDIDIIDLSVGHKYKDFGQGFYLTPDKGTAERMAVKKANLLGGIPTVISYEFLMPVSDSGFEIKIFPKLATAEWVRFVYANRDRSLAPRKSQYDVVIGPIADDGVVLQLTNFRDRMQTAEETARRLQDKYLDQQYFFGTTKALSLLTKLTVWQIN